MSLDSEFKEKRHQLIREIIKKGIKDKNLLDSMIRIPRELFVDPSFKTSAYKDSALPIDCGQTISQPYTVAFMTQALKVEPGQKILEIGTGSGYQACLLFMMGANVYTIERHEGLFQKTAKLFKKFDVKVNCKLGDGSLGWEKFAPFDRIIVTAAAPNITESLKKQLKVGGRLVIPVGGSKEQEMMLIEKISDNKFRETKKGKFKFVPMIGQEGFKEK